jgi:sporulation protein YlmC with PRC-barrel domain
VIQPYCFCRDENNPCSNCDTPGYRWSGSTLYIELPGEYVFADANFLQTELIIDSSGVTVDGSNANIGSIAGQPDLDLRNIKTGSITQCNNISNSIFSSAGTVHGNIENSEILMSSGSFTAVGIGQVLGSVKNSVISVNSGHFTTVGIGQVVGNIENTEISVNSGHFTAVGIGEVLGNIENTEILVNSGHFTAVGIGQVLENIENTVISVNSGHFTIVGIGQILGSIENIETLVNPGPFSVVGIGDK